MQENVSHPYKRNTKQTHSPIHCQMTLMNWFFSQIFWKGSRMGFSNLDLKSNLGLL